jgi:hypothetical protein
VEEALHKITGRAWNVRIEAAPGEASGGASARRGEAAPGENGAETAVPSRSRRPKSELLQQPLIQRAMDLMGAQVLHMDEGFGSAPAAPAPRAVTDDPEEA